MYQPQPAGGQPPLPDQPPRPLLLAVKFMYIGAGLEALGAIVSLLSISRSPANPSGIGGAAIGFALWLWLARASRDGKKWARITGTVLFGIDTIVLLVLLLAAGALTTHGGSGASTSLVAMTIIAGVLIWLAGLGATILLWRPESSAYFRAMSGQ